MYADNFKSQGYDTVAFIAGYMKEKVYSSSDKIKLLEKRFIR